MKSCPPADDLARLGLDPMNHETDSTIEEHIACCPECQAVLERLVRDEAGPAASPVPWPAWPLPARDDRPRLPGFAIEREIGRGSMSVVYLARQPSLGRLVALKVVRSGPAAGSREYARWLREGRSFSRVRHENVVRLHDVGEAAGWLYLVLEYVPGGTLADRLDVPYAGPDGARLLATIADAVEAIHRAGLLHLDLKPSNILMDAPPGSPRERATPRVGDFGLAYLWDDPDATSSTSVPAGPIGTPRYMAPEQTGPDRDRLGPASDVYGLGALLYHAITGRPPFAAASVAETLHQVRTQEPVPPRRLNPSIHRDLETICLQCLRKEPAQRYASAGAVADDLRRYLDGRPILARSATPAERAWRACRRHPDVAALALALAAALIVGFVGMLLLWMDARSRRDQYLGEELKARAAQAWAEAAQRRSEADFRLAADVLGDLVEVNTGVDRRRNLGSRPESLIERLEDGREHVLKLADRLDRRAIYAHLMAIDVRLIDAIHEASQPDRLRPLLENSLRDAREAIRLFPRDAFLREWIAFVLNHAGGMADKEGRWADAGAIHEEALAFAADDYRAAPGPPAVGALLSIRRSLATARLRSGHAEEARELLLANHRTLDEIPAAWLDEPIVALRALNPIIHRHLGFEPPPGHRTDHDGPLSAIARLGSPEADGLAADAWAGIAARALRCDDPHRPASFREARAVFLFGAWIEWVAAEQRRWGQHDRARQTVARLVSLARLVKTRNPTDPDSHLLLAQAREQECKNLWQVHDFPVLEPILRPVIRSNIEHALRRAINANRRGVELAPHDPTARRNLEVRERKLEGLLHPASPALIIRDTP